MSGGRRAEGLFSPLNHVATAFDSKHDSRVGKCETLNLLDQFVPAYARAEMALCYTTGRVILDYVSSPFRATSSRFLARSQWAFHAHDTLRLGASNVLGAWHNINSRKRSELR